MSKNSKSNNGITSKARKSRQNTEDDARRCFEGRQITILKKSFELSDMYENVEVRSQIKIGSSWYCFKSEGWTSPTLSDSDRVTMQTEGDYMTKNEALAAGLITLPISHSAALPEHVPVAHAARARTRHALIRQESPTGNDSIWDSTPTIVDNESPNSSLFSQYGQDEDCIFVGTNQSDSMQVLASTPSQFNVSSLSNAMDSINDAENASSFNEVRTGPGTINPSVFEAKQTWTPPSTHCRGESYNDVSGTEPRGRSLTSYAAQEGAQGCELPSASMGNQNMMECADLSQRPEFSALMDAVAADSVEITLPCWSGDGSDSNGGDDSSSKNKRKPLPSKPEPTEDDGSVQRKKLFARLPEFTGLPPTMAPLRSTSRKRDRRSHECSEDIGTPEMKRHQSRSR